MSKSVAPLIVDLVVAAGLLISIGALSGTRAARLSESGGPIPPQLLESCPPVACGGADMRVED